jgi:hypothetical protein
MTLGDKSHGLLKAIEARPRVGTAGLPTPLPNAVVVLRQRQDGRTYRSFMAVNRKSASQRNPRPIMLLGTGFVWRAVIRKD